MDPMYLIQDRNDNTIDKTTDYELARDIAKFYGAKIRVITAVADGRGGWVWSDSHGTR